MANRTVKDAKSIRGTNPQFLIEKIIRSRIYECKFWKEECFALSAELIVDKAMELKYVGGVYGGNVKPSPFLCLTLKMLQIQPEKDIIVEFIKNEEFKYVRALGAYYMRLVGTSIECYKYLEPLLNDGRKLRVLTRDGGFTLTHIDEFIDSLLHEERLFDVILPRIQKRQVLEEGNELEPRISALEDDENENDGDSSGDERDGSMEKMGPPPAPQMSSNDKRKSSGSLALQGASGSRGGVDVRNRETAERNKERERPRERDRRDRDRDREREKPRSDKDKYVSNSSRRSRSRSRERRHRSRSPAERGRYRDDRERDRGVRRRDDRDRRQERDYDRRRDRDRANGYG